MGSPHFDYYLNTASSGVTSEITHLYANDTKISHCMVDRIKVDMEPPSFTPYLHNSITRHSNLAPKIYLNNGTSPILDYGTGVSRVEIGLGSNPSGGDVIPFLNQDPLMIFFTANVPALNQGVDYYITIKAWDYFNYESVRYLGPFRYEPCPIGTTSDPNGNCY